MQTAQERIRELFTNRLAAGESLLNGLLSHLSVKAFQKKNPDVPVDAYRRSIPKLDQYIREQENCAKCGGLDTCKNFFAGYHSELIAEEGRLDLRMKQCNRLVAYEEMKKRQSLFKIHRIPQSVMSATFETIDLDGRTNIIEQVMDYCGSFENGTPKKGLYLYGTFGVGKSHIAAAMANHLVRTGIDSFMVYVPDFVREANESIQDKTTGKLMSSLKKVKLLILDDIGAENMSAWFRDTILGSVLQHRMGNDLPTIFTSNLTLDELENHMAYTTKGGREPVKATRIMERIKHYVKPIHVTGRNRRANN